MAFTRTRPLARETCRKAQEGVVELEMNAVDTFRATRTLPRAIVTMNDAVSELRIIEDTGYLAQM